MHDLPYIRVDPARSTSIGIHAVQNNTARTFLEYHQMKGHAGIEKMREWHKPGCVPKEALIGAEGHACTSCTVTNARKLQYPTVDTDHRAQFPNHVFHADLLHVSKPDHDGHLYMLVILDERTRYAFIHLLKRKNEALPLLRSTLNRASVIRDRTVVWLRTDLGGEFGGAARQQLEVDMGIAGQRVPAGCHQSNGTVERLNLTFMDKVRASCHAGDLPMPLWGEVARSVVHTYNITPHSFLMEHPHEGSTVPHLAYMQDSLTRVQALVKALVPCGTRCVVVKTLSHLGKTEDRGIRGVILGSCDSTSHYRVLIEGVNGKPQIQVHRHVIVQPEAMRAVMQRDQLPSVAAFEALPASHVRIVADMSNMGFNDKEDTVDNINVLVPYVAPLPSRPFEAGEDMFLPSHGRKSAALDAGNVYTDADQGVPYRNEVQPAPGPFSRAERRVSFIDDYPRQRQAPEALPWAPYARVDPGRARSILNIKTEPDPSPRTGMGQTLDPGRPSTAAGTTAPVIEPAPGPKPRKVLKIKKRQSDVAKTEKVPASPLVRRAKAPSPEASPATSRALSPVFSTDIPDVLDHSGEHVPKDSDTDPDALSLDTVSPMYSIVLMVRPGESKTDQIADANKFCAALRGHPHSTIRRPDGHDLVAVIEDAKGEDHVIYNAGADADAPEAKHALAGDDAPEWNKALDEELAALEKAKVFDLVQRPKNKPVTKGLWVCRLKRDQHGAPVRYKARYCAKGYSQIYGVDFNATWSPTGQHASLKLICLLAVMFGLELRHVDIKCAFTNGDLEEEVYVEQPMFRTQKGTNYVWRLRKALYGLKQAARQWHKKLSEQLEAMGFERSKYDPALFILKCGMGFIHIHVDDLFFAIEPKLVNKYIEQLLEAFEGRDLGEVSWLLGMEAQRNKDTKQISFTQKLMIENVLKRFDMRDCKPVSTPIETGAFIGRNPNERELYRITETLKDSSEIPSQEVERLESKKTELTQAVIDLTGDEHKRYMSIVGALQYIAVVTRPDISFATAMLARYMSNPTNYLMKCAKRVLRYLAGTTSHGLVLSGTEGKDLKVIGYADADYAGCCDTRKATSGMALFVNGSLVKWRTKRQPITATSTTEAELIALTACALDTEWLRLILEDMKVSAKLVELKCDNQSAELVARNPIASDRTRHIEIRHRKVQELVEQKRMTVSWISTKDQVADVFTKPLPKDLFELFRTKLGVLRL